MLEIDDQFLAEASITTKLVMEHETRFRAEQDAEKFDPNGTTSVEANTDELYELYKYDFKSFIMLFLYEEQGIEHGIPDFHIFGFKKMTKVGGKPVAIAWPRDHAKTTLAKIAIIWLMIYTDYRFPLYACHVQKLAANALKDVTTMMELDSVTSIYGVPKFSQRAEALGEYTLRWRNKTIIMRAIGVGGSVRGLVVNNKRPDVLVLDDIEKAEEGEENKFGYDGIKTWFFGTLRKCLDRRGHKIFQIGNFVSAKSLLGDNLSSQYWDSTKLAAITKDGKPLWAARWSINALRADLLEYMENGKMGVWLCEMLNMPLNEAHSLIKSSDINLSEKIYPDDEGIMLRCITVDPAITENLAYADSAVIAVHVYKGHKWHLADITAKKGIGVYQLYAEIIKLAAKWRVNTVGIETEAYQEAARQVCEQEAARAQINNMHFLPLKTGKKRKATRIAAFASMLKQGLYGMSSDFISVFEELMTFDVTSKTNTDDKIDCCAYILKMIELYLPQMAELISLEDEIKVQAESASMAHIQEVMLRH